MERIARLVVILMVVASVVFGGAALAWGGGGSDKPGKGCGDKNHWHYNEGDCKPPHNPPPHNPPPHNPPPRWKMAIATYLGVLPVVMFLSLTIGPAIRSWNFVLSNAVFNACVVAGLTWVVMPLITRLLHGWLNPQPQTKDKII